MHSSNGRGIAVLRWAAVLPTAVGAYVLSGLLFYMIGGARPDAIMTLTNYCVSPIVFVYCGTRVAPSHRFGAAIALTILLAISVTALFTWSATARGYDDWLQTSKALTWAILGVISALATSFFILQTEHENREIERLLREKKLTGNGTERGGNS